jgi:transcriptional regulator with GAF, ATPase, and Fis domain
MMHDPNNESSEPSRPTDAFGTLTTLVHRSKYEDSSFQGFQLLVLQATGLAVYPLPEAGSMTIGRAEECDVQLRDPLASRRHATLHVDPLAIEDRGSANGTLVGNRHLEPGSSTPVQPGQAIAIGNSLLIVRRAELGKSAERSSVDRLSWASGNVLVKDPAMANLYALIDRLAAGPIHVLVLGETGVGKEVIAETIHRKSPRHEAPLVRINCAALSESLLESELFGHERGAFTGAVTSKPGLIEIANGGTVFLDEVGELSPTLQAKLLRVIDARELTRLGGLRPRPVDVRFVSATNRDLEASVANGSFRADLFFRLNGGTVRIPPLRERPCEILPLAAMFMARVADQMNLPAQPRLLPAAEELLVRYPWPGNVRELRNIIERAVLLSPNGHIGPSDLELTSLPSSDSTSARPSLATVPPAAGPAAEWAGQQAPKRQPSDPAEDERARIIRALEMCSGNQTRAAKLLHMPRRTLVAKLPRYNIPRPRKPDPSS